MQLLYSLHQFSTYKRFNMQPTPNAIITKPERPNSDECCGGGSCSPCVWDEYKQKLALWKTTQLPSKTLNENTK